MKYNFDLNLSHANSLLYILERIQKNSVVLEFGPANGRLTKYMKEELNCKVYLAEIDEEAGKEALKYGEDLVVGDVENYDWFVKYRDIKFDYLIFADILEHLRDPKQLLVQSKLLLKQDGAVLLSVPNLAHNSIIINLLNHKFHYNNVGLLDDTHIHFFTKYSLEQMLEEAGLFVSARMATYCKVGENEIDSSLDDVHGIDETFWNTREYGEVYQYIYEAKKSREFIGKVDNYLESGISSPYLQMFSWYQEYREESSQKRYLKNSLAEKHKFHFQFPECVRRFRLDPLNGPCIVKINSIKAYKGSKSLNICMKHNSAYYYFDSIFIFQDNDPNIEYECETDKGIDSIDLELEFLTISRLEVEHIIQTLENLLGNKCSRLSELYTNVEKLQHKIERQTLELDELRTQLEKKNYELEQKSKLLDEVKNSNSWKMTEIFRRLNKD